MNYPLSATEFEPLLKLCIPHLEASIQKLKLVHARNFFEWEQAREKSDMAQAKKHDKIFDLLWEKEQDFHLAKDYANFFPGFNELEKRRFNNQCKTMTKKLENLSKQSSISSSWGKQRMNLFILTLIFLAKSKPSINYGWRY